MDTTPTDERSGPRVDPPPWVTWEEPEERPPTRRVPWLIVAGIVPWVVLAIVLAGRTRSAAVAPAPTDAPVAVAPAADPPADLTAGPSPSAEAASPGLVVATGARTVPDEGEAGALAVLVARAWLTGVGPRLTIAGAAPPEPPGDAYAEHVAVEAVDHPAPGAAVVTVVAVVLHARDGTYDEVVLRRLAVPLRLDATGARPAGAPWDLPVDPLELAFPQVSEVLDAPELLVEAGEALTEAGYVVEEVRGLARTDGWPLVVTAVATAPGADASREHVVWLREHLGRLVVAGTRPPSAPTHEVTP